VHIDVIEFEMTCPIHGPQRTIAPVEGPRPHNCVHCFAAVIERHELRRFSMEGPLPNAVASEAWIG
jgi:hypothetical protein